MFKLRTRDHFRPVPRLGTARNSDGRSCGVRVGGQWDHAAAGEGYEGACQYVVQARSLSGLSTAQMCLIWSPAMSNAITVTVTPSCWATRPAWPLTVHSRIVMLGAALA